ncbi:MAG: hypothetical protein CMH60_02105 [Myxococcales bacterium]|nr:hypothetical protein [Myxococcales bacterium]
MQKYISVLGFLLCFSGCSSDLLNPNNEDLNPQEELQPLSVEELCIIYLSKNDNSNLCVDGFVGTGLDYTQDEIDNRCRPGTSARVWAEDLHDSITQERVRIDIAMARNCLDSSRELRQTVSGRLLAKSSEWNLLQQNACERFYQAGQNEGDICHFDWDCPTETSCASAAPWTEGGARCLKPAQLGAACSSYRGCGTGLGCEEGICVALLTDGEACDPYNFGSECASGYCDEATSKCGQPEAAPEYKSEGEECLDATECDPERCMLCKPANIGAISTCQSAGGQGDYCRAHEDCSSDLGCTNFKCTSLDEGQACGPNDGMCKAEYSCIPEILCYEFDGDQESCAAQSICLYDETSGYCDAVQGRCSTLPESGACKFGYACAASTYCDPATTTCLARAATGASCSADGQSGPPCAAGNTCEDGVCKANCEFDEDCGDGSYCDENYYCQSHNLTACETNMACGDDKYCDLPGDECGYYTDQETCGADNTCQFVDQYACQMTTDCAGIVAAEVCTADSSCTWLADYSACRPACWAHDGNQSACEEAGSCVYGSNGYCDPDCSTYEDESTCSANPTCTYKNVGYCQSVPGTCLEKLAVGETCESSSACQSGDCSQADDGQMRCAVELSGCNRDADFLKLAFLYGGFLFLRRRRKSSQERSA